MANTTTVLFEGDEAAAAALKGVALNQLNILRNAMSFQGLLQDKRTLTYDDGTVIHCESVFGKDTVIVYVPLYEEPQVVVPEVLRAKPVAWEHLALSRFIYEESKIVDYAIDYEGKVFTDKRITDYPKFYLRILENITFEYNNNLFIHSITGELFIRKGLKYLRLTEKLGFTNAIYEMPYIYGCMKVGWGTSTITVAGRYDLENMTFEDMPVVEDAVIPPERGTSEVNFVFKVEDNVFTIYRHPFDLCKIKRGYNPAGPHRKTYEGTVITNYVVMTPKIEDFSAPSIRIAGEDLDIGLTLTSLGTAPDNFTPVSQEYDNYTPIAPVAGQLEFYDSSSSFPHSGHTASYSKTYGNIVVESTFILWAYGAAKLGIEFNLFGEPVTFNFSDLLVKCTYLYLSYKISAMAARACDNWHAGQSWKSAERNGRKCSIFGASTIRIQTKFEGEKKVDHTRQNVSYTNSLRQVWYSPHCEVSATTGYFICEDQEDADWIVAEGRAGGDDLPSVFVWEDKDPNYIEPHWVIECLSPQLIFLRVFDYLEFYQDTADIPEGKVALFLEQALQQRWSDILPRYGVSKLNEITYDTLSFPRCEDSIDLMPFNTLSEAYVINATTVTDSSFNTLYGAIIDYQVEAFYHKFAGIFKDGDKIPFTGFPNLDAQSGAGAGLRVVLLIETVEDYRP